MKKLVYLLMISLFMFSQTPVNALELNVEENKKIEFTDLKTGKKTIELFSKQFNLEVHKTETITTPNGELALATEIGNDNGIVTDLEDNLIMLQISSLDLDSIQPLLSSIDVPIPTYTLEKMHDKESLFTTDFFHTKSKKTNLFVGVYIKYVDSDKFSIILFFDEKTYKEFKVTHTDS